MIDIVYISFLFTYTQVLQIAPLVYLYLLLLIDQKAIEYPSEGSSGVPLHPTQLGQVQGEGGTRIVYVPVPGKGYFGNLLYQ